MSDCKEGQASTKNFLQKQILLSGTVGFFFCSSPVSLWVELSTATTSLPSQSVAGDALEIDITADFFRMTQHLRLSTCISLYKVWSLRRFQSSQVCSAEKIALRKVKFHGVGSRELCVATGSHGPMGTHMWICPSELFQRNQHFTCKLVLEHLKIQLSF